MSEEEYLPFYIINKTSCQTRNQSFSSYPHCTCFKDLKIGDPDLMTMIVWWLLCSFRVGLREFTCSFDNGTLSAPCRQPTLRRRTPGCPATHQVALRHRDTPTSHRRRTCRNLTSSREIYPATSSKATRPSIYDHRQYGHLSPVVTPYICVGLLPEDPVSGRHTDLCFPTSAHLGVASKVHM